MFCVHRTGYSELCLAPDCICGCGAAATERAHDSFHSDSNNQISLNVQERPRTSLHFQIVFLGNLILHPPIPEPFFSTCMLSPTRPVGGSRLFTPCLSLGTSTTANQDVSTPCIVSPSLCIVVSNKSIKKKGFKNNDSQLKPEKSKKGKKERERKEKKSDPLGLIPKCVYRERLLLAHHPNRSVLCGTKKKTKETQEHSTTKRMQVDKRRTALQKRK